MTTEALDFYAYWNGAQVADLWTTLALITGTDDYRSLLLCVALFGLICAAAGAAVRYRGGDLIVWIAAMVFIFSAAFVPRVNIAVRDVRSANVQVVQNIPLGIGWPASVISRASYWLTESFETAFGDVDAARYTRFGVAFPQRVVTTMLSVKPITADGKMSLTNFTERCIVPEILENSVKRQELLNAPDINALISTNGWVNPARRVFMNNKVLTCTQAAEELKKTLEKTEIPALESRLRLKLNVDFKDGVNAALSTAIPQAESIMLGVSRTMAESLRQSLMMSAIPDTTMTFAAKAGQAPLSAGVAIARSQGNLASEINYRTLSEMARSALPKLRNILEFTVIGLWPMVFLMMLGTGTGGAMVCRAYFTLLISVSLWAPITAIINYLTLHLDMEPMNQLVNSAGGVTLAAATMIRDAGATSQAMAGSLLWLVPVLAYAVAKGSDMALTAMTSSVLAPASSAAQAQGSQLAMGNVSAGNASLNNASLNNMSGNKTDTSSSWADPNTHKVELAQGTAAFDRSAGQMTAMNVRKSDLGVSSDTANMNAVQDANNFGTSSVATNASSLATNSGVQAVSGSGVTNSVNRDDGWSVTRNSGTTYGTNESVNYGTVTSSVFGANGGRSGKSDDNFSYRSGLSVTTGFANTLNTASSQAKTGSADSTVDGNVSVSNLFASNEDNNSLNLSMGTPLIQNIGSFANKPKSSTDKGQVTSISKIDTSQIKGNIQNDIFKLNATPTATNTAGLTDVGGFTFGSSKQDTFHNASGFAFGEQVGESTAILNGTRNTLSDTTNAQLNEQNSLTHGRTSSDSTSELDSATHSASKGTSQNVTQDRDNIVRDLGLAMAGGDAFEALRMFNSTPESRAALKELVDQQQSGLEKVLPPAANSLAKKREEFIGKTRENIEKDYQASSTAVQATSNDSIQRRSSEQHISMQNKSDFMAQTRKERDIANFKIGLSMVATSEYLQKETGILSVIERAYGVGFSYTSPQELYQDLNIKAQEDPQLKETLTNLGSIAHPGISEKEIIDKLQK
jgi:hypothetical protein